MTLSNNTMGKKTKIPLGKRQLTPKEMRILEEGLEIKTTNIFGNPIIIRGKKCDDGFRIAETKQHTYPSSTESPFPDEEIWVYNSKGILSTRIYNQKITYSI